jgi:hypothetical protein
MIGAQHNEHEGLLRSAVSSAHFYIPPKTWPALQLAGPFLFTVLTILQSLLQARELPFASVFEAVMHLRIRANSPRNASLSPHNAALLFWNLYKYK